MEQDGKYHVSHIVSTKKIREEESDCPHNAVTLAKRTSRSDFGSWVLHSQLDWEQYIVVV